MTDTEARVRAILSDVAGVPAGAGAQAHLYSELGVESVDAIRLLVAMEEGFGVRIPDEEWLDATSIAQLTALIDGRRSSAPA